MDVLHLREVRAGEVRRPHARRRSRGWRVEISVAGEDQSDARHGVLELCFNFRRTGEQSIT